MKKKKYIYNKSKWGSVLNQIDLTDILKISFVCVCMPQN